MISKRLFALVTSATIAGLVYFLFDRYAVTGVGYSVADSTTSLFTWLRARWLVSSPYGHDFPHAWLVPWISVAMTVWMLPRLRAARSQPSWMGFGAVLMALLVLWVAARAQQPRLAGLAFILMVWGIPYHLFGWGVARLMMAPCAFLIFTFPFDLLENTMQRLRHGAAVVSSGLLSGFGVPTRLDDTTTIRLLTDPERVLALSSQAGGVGSLMYLLASAYLVSWFLQRRLGHLAVLVAATPVVVVLANTARTLLQAMGALLLGSRGEHALGGAPSFYVVALLLLYACHRLAGIEWRARLQAWRRSLEPA